MEEHESAQDCLDNLAAYIQLLETENQRLRDAASEVPVHRPEPMLERPAKGQIYWVPDVSKLDCAFCSSWLGSSFDNLIFNRGLCYATEEDAVAAAKAMVGEVSDE